MRIPFERPNIQKKNSLDYYIFKVRELHKNILKAINNSDDRFAIMAFNHFNSVFPCDWEERLVKLETFIDNYNNRFLSEKHKQEERTNCD